MGTDETGSDVVAHSDDETVKKAFEIMLTRGVDAHTALSVLLALRDSGILLVDKEK